MMNRAAVLAALLLVPAAAWADQPTTTTTAGTVVVVTPQAPVVVGPPQQPMLAPPGAAEEPPPAPPAGPQNEAWSNVSHINGTPVPVGERNRYLYDYKRTNLTANPFGLFLGYYDVGLAHGVSQNVAIAASVTGIGTELNDGYQLTASVPIYFRRTFSGPYLEPGLIVRDTETHVAVDCVNAACPSNPSDRWAGVEMLFGWQWMFDSGLNVQLAMGVARHLTSNQMGSSSDGADANGYFRVGYAF